MSGKGGGVSDLKVGRRGQLDGEALTLVCWCVVAVGGDEQGGTEKSVVVELGRQASFWRSASGRVVGGGVFRRAVRGGGGNSRRGAGEGRLQEAGRGASRIAFLRTSA